MTARRLVLTVASLLSAVAAHSGRHDLAGDLATIGDAPHHDSAMKIALSFICDKTAVPLDRALAVASYVFISSSVRAASFFVCNACVIGGFF